MTCKDCLHVETCVAVKAMGEEQRYAEQCKSFKNKADYAEVKHGKWMQDFDEDYYCSLCGRYPKKDVRDYCPYCGAKMDSQL